jgi:hypothetical protein
VKPGVWNGMLLMVEALSFIENSIRHASFQLGNAVERAQEVESLLKKAVPWRLSANTDLTNFPDRKVGLRSVLLPQALPKAKSPKR